MKEIKHKNWCCRLKQSDKPLCGIYAFLNGVFSQKDILKKRKQINEVADKIWWMSLDKKIEVKGTKMIAKSDLSFSLVGEFFASNAIKDFFDYRESNSDNQGRNRNKNHLDILKELQAIDNTIEDYTIETIGKEEKFRDLYHKIKDENTFFIIPYNVEKNVHWICLKYIQSEEGYCILNSARRSANEYYSQKAKTKKRFKLETLDQVMDAWNYVIEAKSENGEFSEFDFSNWAKEKSVKNCEAKRKYKRMVKKYDKENNSLVKRIEFLYEKIVKKNNEKNNNPVTRIKLLKKSCIKYEYSYNEECGDKVYSKFDILKVTVKRN